ncbi:MAG: TolC family protein [Ignavibacteriales bacterium]|nr:TolC family protein [Ignavibacteriales bacterium]
MTIRSLSRIGYLIFVFILIIQNVHSQTEIKKPLSLQEAIQIAMVHNPELKTAQLEIERSDARVLEAWGNAMPSLDISGRFTRALKLPVFFLPDFEDLNSGRTIPIKIGSDYSLDATLTAQQILFNGAVIVGVGAAKVYSNLAKDLYESKRVETVAKVRKAYYTALLADKVVEMMRSSLKNAEDNFKNVLLMRKQGIVSEYDELRASVQVENLRPSVIQSENNFELSVDALRNAIGVDKDENYIMTDSMKIEFIEESVIESAEEMVLKSNPNLKAVERQIELNNAAVWAERSSYMPTIAAFGQYQYQAAKNEFKFSTNDLISSSMVGLTVSMNLFQGLQTRARVEQAQVEQMKSEEQKVSLERNLKTGLHSIIGNLRQARKRVEAQQKTVETAERGYKIVSASYLANAATQLEVNDAEVALTQAKVNRIQAIYDYLVASAEFDQLIGRVPGYLSESKNSENLK